MRAAAVPPALAAACLLAAGCATTPAPGVADARTPAPPPPPRHTLRAEAAWSLDPPGPGRFDASALVRLPDGDLLTVNDKALPACRIALVATNRGVLVPDPALFPPESVASLPGAGAGPVDAEGLAVDDAGRIYLATEARRWILRHDPRSGAVERLPIDWSPAARWFSARDGNASFEGVAVGGGNLYVANERETARILVVDLASMRVTDDFAVAPPGVSPDAVHYSDLCWSGNALWVLCRPQRCVLEVDPATRTVTSVFDYAAVETAAEHAFFSVLPVGFVEGLWVDGSDIWLLVDNNGLPRRSALRDTRPLLFRCPRPDR